MAGALYAQSRLVFDDVKTACMVRVFGQLCEFLLQNDSEPVEEDSSGQMVRGVEAITGFGGSRTYY